MNSFLRFVIGTWLLLCAFLSWVFMNMVATLLLISTNAYDFAPIFIFASFTTAVACIKCSMYVLLKSKPADYIDQKMEWIYEQAKRILFFRRS